MSRLSLLYYIVILFSLILESFQTDDYKTYLSALNTYRAVTYPSPARMTCLNWNPTFVASVKFLTSKCTTPTGKNIIFDARSSSAGETDLLNIAGDWFIDGSTNYDYDMNDCNDNSKDDCKTYKILVNDQANSVACAQGLCSAGAQICPAKHESCIFTVCMFNADVPKQQPYVKSNIEGFACTENSCRSASDPTKIECVNHLCCAGETARHHEL